MTAIMIRKWLTPSPPLDEGETEPPVATRLFWFAGLSLAGVIVVSTMAYLLRTLLFIG